MVDRTISFASQIAPRHENLFIKAFDLFAVLAARDGRNQPPYAFVSPRLCGGPVGDIPLQF
ncbi:MAG TPA: hypothetical protein VII48_12410 [Rhizomicrobium sp.]